MLNCGLVLHYLLFRLVLVTGKLELVACQFQFYSCTIDNINRRFTLYPVVTVFTKGKIVFKNDQVGRNLISQFLSCANAKDGYTVIRSSCSEAHALKHVL